MKYLFLLALLSSMMLTGSAVAGPTKCACVAGPPTCLYTTNNVPAVLCASWCANNCLAYCVPTACGIGARVDETDVSDDGSSEAIAPAQE